MEYEVLWGDGPLGLTLRPDLGEDMPPVVGRITRLDSAAALAKVAVGDMLVSINGIDTARQGYDHVVDLLQRIPRPATLRFRVPRPMVNMPSMGIPRVPSMMRDQRSSRGLAAQQQHQAQARGSTSSVSSTGSAAGIPTPSSSRKHEQYTVVWTEGPLGMILRPDDDDVHVPCIRKITGKGAGTGMERAAVGDVLVAVNGQETKSLGFRSTISLLKTIRKPAVLKFKRMHRRLSRRRSSREDEAAAAAAGGAPVPSGVVGGSHSISGSSPSSVLPHPLPSGSSGIIPKEYGAYDIVWREGDLGLKLKPGDRDVPVLSKLTGKGTASGLQNAAVGDELVSVNGALVEGQAYHDTLRMLKHSVKPAVLRFRPGRDRRASGISVSSTRSAPSTHREVQRVRSGHVPIYDTGRTPASGAGSSSPMPHGSSHYNKPPSRSPSGERVKKKKRIPLELAKELVAASQSVELSQAVFAGMPILAIEEGTHEAHLLRVEAKMCINTKGERQQQQRNGMTPKEALLQAEQEARVLQEALERVKSQAKAYEQALEHQKRDQLLASATRNKSGDVVQKHNILLDELAGRIAGLKRDSYGDEVDVVPMTLDDPEHIQGLMDDLQSVMNIPVVVPSTKYCAECGATEKESELDLDDDGQHYCKDCWDNFLSAPGVDTVPVAVAVAVVDDPPPPPAPVAVEQKPDAPAANSFSPPPSQPALTKGESTTSLSRLSSVEREQEEKDARVEAEQKLMELKEMTRTGSMRSIERQSSNVNAADRTRRERLGLEELAQALQEEEERARADGNIVLAKKLSAQRARTMAEARAEQKQQLNGGASPMSSLRDLAQTSESEFSRFYKNGKNGSSVPPLSSSYDGPRSVLAKAASSEFDVPAPASLKRCVTMDSPYAAASASTSSSLAQPLAEMTLASAPSPANDYEDVNSDEEAEDQVDGMSDEEQDVLREQEEKNYAMAKQLGEAHTKVERARMSIMLTGDEVADDVTAALGLSDEQISLFKKLTSQADERMSTVDRLHPDVDDSDSDSDESVMDGVEEGDEDEEEEEEEEEEDEGVWI